MHLDNKDGTLFQHVELPTVQIARHSAMKLFSSAKSTLESETEAHMESLNALVFLMVIGTTIWVGFDASANKVTSDGKDYRWSNGAIAWVVGCVLLWIIVFP